MPVGVGAELALALEEGPLAVGAALGEGSLEFVGALDGVGLDEGAEPGAIGAELTIGATPLDDVLIEVESVDWAGAGALVDGDAVEATGSSVEPVSSGSDSPQPLANVKAISEGSARARNANRREVSSAFMTV
jgi:hypothetical protein